MAKGDSGSKKAKGKNSYKNSVSVGNDTIEYDGTLKYGGLDKSLSAKQRKTIENFENKRYKNKIEYGLTVDGDGNIVGKEHKGGKGSVRSTYAEAMTKDNVFSHNHPRGDGELGGTFSDSDLRNFIMTNRKTTRATAKEGTYSISKTNNFDGSGLRNYYAREDKKAYKKYANKMDSLRDDYYSNRISYNDLDKQAKKAFNTYLVDSHNILLDGQSKYGYTYTLEKR